ncbi:TPA: hypothetical protein DDZ86_01880 [Candidatus Dependentiae bacterium]|nr:MAG: hypothetical protein UW09_C0001G0260 [candidate division TM6 bacterium GW2011_GWF2_43_87]HBL98374.1 hypothetical protein [Candidatus Dependentiae bacterium]
MGNRPFFAEVVESALSHFKALCWDWNSAIPFGSLVIAEKESLSIFAVVSSIETGSSDPTRQPIAYQKTEQELKRDHPHIFEFLQTKLTCTVIGFTKGASPFHSELPPHPASIHTFVRPARDDEQLLAFASGSFLHRLCAELPPTAADELILALIRNRMETKPFTSAELNELTLNIAALVENDYQRLKRFFTRLDNCIKTNTSTPKN